MAQIIGLICISVFFILGVNIVKQYFHIEIKEKINTAFFLMICVAVCEFAYKSVNSGAMYDGKLLEYATDGGEVYNFVCTMLGKLIYGKTDIVKLMLGTLCFGLAIAEFENVVFYPFAFLCFSEGGVLLLFAVLAVKYAENFKAALLFTLCAVILDFRAAVLLVYILSKHTAANKYSMYFYGAATLILNVMFGKNILFAPAYAYALDKINDKYINGAVKAVSTVLMGYSLVSLF